MKIQSLPHVCLKTSDLARTEAFYCGILGLTKKFSFTQRGAVIGFYLQAGNSTFLEVFHDSEAVAGTPRRAIDHFCFETDDIEGLRRRLVERGYAARGIIMGADNAWQFWVTDPNGIEIEFQQYAEKSSQITGGQVDLP